MGPDKYKGYSLPIDMAEEIRKIIEDKSNMYTSETDFIKEAVRVRIAYHKRRKA